MWRIVIYDLCEPDEPAIAVCVLSVRGEYELLNHRFDDGSYRWRTITEEEYSSLTAFDINLPLKRINEFCLTERSYEWTGTT